jgi:trans-aconitate 2-methyltransferase
MDNHESIVDWFRSTALRPFLEPLNEAERAGFLAAYRERLVASYPVQRDGRVLLAFPRRFIVAMK